MPLAVGAGVWLLPHTAFTPKAWGLLALFAATVCALMTRPLASGAVVLLAITARAFSGSSRSRMRSPGFGNTTVWLIVAAFMFARGIIQTRLGERIAYQIIRRFGGSALRLGSSIVVADLVMAPMTPSNTARAGGILFPITLSVARAFGSEPGPTAALIGAFLMTTLYQGDLVVSAMFLTATAPNPLVAELTRQSSGLELSWTMWALAASLPGIVALVVVPLVVYRLCPPGLHDTRPAQDLADQRLRAMGPPGRHERVMLAVFSTVLLLWLSAEWHGASPTAIAYLGLALLLVTRVLDWQDVLAETRRVGCADLVRRPGHAGGAARQGRPAEGVCRRGSRPGRRVAVVVGAGRADGRLSLLPLCVCQPGRARHGDVPCFLRRRGGPRRTAAADGARLSGSSRASTPPSRTTARARRPSCSAPAT